MNAQLERVDGWRCSDGTIFHRTEQEKAQEHQTKLNFVVWCHETFAGSWTIEQVASKIWLEWEVRPQRPADFP